MVKNNYYVGSYKRQISKIKYRKCEKSGIQLPEISLRLWHNFGGVDVFDNYISMLRTAFDRGITHFDLANTNDPPSGYAEKIFWHNI